MQVQTFDVHVNEGSIWRLQDKQGRLILNARLAAFGHLLILEKPCCPNDLFQKKATVCAKLAKEQSSSFLLLAFFFFFFHGKYKTCGQQWRKWNHTMLAWGKGYRSRIGGILICQIHGLVICGLAWSFLLEHFFSFLLNENYKNVFGCTFSIVPVKYFTRKWKRVINIVGSWRW